MRQLLAVAVLGATLALGAGVVFASDNVDYKGPYQPVQVLPDESQTESGQFVVAGGDDTSPAPYQQLREENFGR